MALFTKCILKAKSEEDGYRLSVMSRHTLNDGETPDTRITDGSFDAHCPELAPSPKLIGDYYKRGLDLRWHEFEARFREEIKQELPCKILRIIATMACIGNVTLLCIEEDAEHCHRRILAEECKKFRPELVIEHH